MQPCTAHIQPATLAKAISVPSSKSYAQRAFAAALLSHGSTEVRNISPCDDTAIMLQLIKNLGAKITSHNDAGNSLTIDSQGMIAPKNELYCGSAALSLRMMAPIVALLSQQVSLQASVQLQSRPQDFLLHQLRQWGVTLLSKPQAWPIQLKGPLQITSRIVEGSHSSQSISGLLMAYAAAAAKDVHIEVVNAVSTPYLYMTVEVLKKFGVAIERNGPTLFYFEPSNKGLVPCTYYVPTDWSSAAFLLVAAATCGKELELKNVQEDDLQGDAQILPLLKKIGAQISKTQDGLVVHKSAFSSFHFDATDAPDLFPPLVVLAAHAHGTSSIKGVHRLLGKESNRAIALQQEISKFGTSIAIEGDTMYVSPGIAHKEVTVHAHHDHRIAMACTLMALNHTCKTTLHHAEAVTKSYPYFYKHLQEAGANIAFTS